MNEEKAMNTENTINKALTKLVAVVKNIDLINEHIESYIKVKPYISPESFYADICILIGELAELYPNEDWEDISYQYMYKIREGIYNGSRITNLSIFGGLSEIGMGAYALSKNYIQYEKFLNSLNKLIVSQIKSSIRIYYKYIGNMNMQLYDLISGLSGTAAYLLWFSYDNEILECIKDILKYFIAITQDIEIQGTKVPGWYIPRENQFIDKDKEQYKKGNFNLGISHGINGPLAIMALAMEAGIEVDGQKEAIKKLLNYLNTFRITEEDGLIYWPGKISLENHIKGKPDLDFNRRASWCYGTPGIARAIYIAAKSINDNENERIALMAMERLCKVQNEKWLLEAPTFCHGFSGILTIFQAFYNDTHNPLFDLARDTAQGKLLECFEEDSVYGFRNIEPKDPVRENYEIIKCDRLDMLEGATGVALTLLSLIKPVKTCWHRKFLIY